MNKKLSIIANWKMNLDYNEARTLVAAIAKQSSTTPHRIGIAPSFPYISEILQQTATASVFVAAQNLASTDCGAYTGEVAASQLQSMGVKSVIVGHSERREYFQETDQIVNEKVSQALKAGLEVILCVGESLSIREQGRAEDVVVAQIRKDLQGISPEEVSAITIAYEPIWAIGTGKTASALDAEAMHVAIRDCVARLYTDAIAQSMAIIYGGSVKPANCSELFAQKNINGALVGGASLKISDFATIMMGGS